MFIAESTQFYKIQPKELHWGIEDRIAHVTNVFINQSNYLFSFFKIFIVIQLQLYAFSPHPSTPPQLNPPPSPTSTLPLGFVHVSFIVVPVNLSPHCPLPTPLWLLLHCS